MIEEAGRGGRGMPQEKTHKDVGLGQELSSIREQSGGVEEARPTKRTKNLVWGLKSLSKCDLPMEP